MKQVQLLDCTLRDGAYLVDKQFGDTTIRGIIDGLVAAKIDVVEIGFLQNEGDGDGITVYKNAKNAEKYIPANRQETKFSVLADYSRYHIKNLEIYNGKSFDIVRECFFKSEFQDAIKTCYKIKEKGYKVFVQPVDILGYSDIELIELLKEINELEPYGMSIVDTFGSMYMEDLHRIFEIIHHNLLPSCKLGFHSHNNMQLSNALSQELIRIATGKRQVIIDGTISGMGRGAGNTPIELISQYLVSQLNYDYNIDVLLDLIDTYMDNIRSKCNWGYNTSYFIAGCYSAHVNNIDYLAKKNSIRHKEMRLILNKIGTTARKRYNYHLLEQTYMEMIQADIDDNDAVNELKKIMENNLVLIVAPGETVRNEKNKILQYIDKEHPIVISVNFIDENIECDYVYMNNVKRYQYWSKNKNFWKKNKILTSNLTDALYPENAIIVSFRRLVKCGWEILDNSVIMLLRLLDEIGVSEIAIAGFDGYSNSENNNYFDKELEIYQTSLNKLEANREIEEMLKDYDLNRKNKSIQVSFITSSRFEKCLNKKKEFT